MHYIIRKFNLRPADRIVVPKSNLRWIQHHAIYLGRNDQGIDIIAENKIGVGVQLVSADEFFKDVITITRIEKFIGSERDRKKAIDRAISLVGYDYDLFQFNCEHYSSVVQHNEKKSNQAETATALGVLTLLFLGLAYAND
jgi:hypothetical protein